MLVPGYGDGPAPIARCGAVLPLSLGQPKLGVGKADLTKLKGKVKHFYHLGAVYDLEASAEAMEKANIAGTRGALEFAEAVNARKIPADAALLIAKSLGVASIASVKSDPAKLAQAREALAKLVFAASAGQKA